ncbi:hypothetical protein OIV83_002770 [Microbotryomycetes sp. JL201]|nr:hypothetical protein OIV83_002770 [Microbotryomycetes sp. JL201]
MASSIRTPVLPTVLDALPSTRPDAPSSVSLMPFSIAYDGPSNMSTFFHPRPTSSTSANDGLERSEAWFRGRRVICTNYTLPKGFNGIVYTTTSPVPPPVVSLDNGSKRAIKKVKLSNGQPLIKDPDEKKSAAVLEGTRKSPRKAAMAKARAAMAKVKKFSLDSDEDAEEEQVEPDINIEGSVRAEEPTARGETETREFLSDAADVGGEISKRPALLPTVSAISTASSATAVDPYATFDKDIESERTESLDDGVDDGEQHLATEERHLLPNLQFGTIKIWHADSEMNLQDDLFARSLTEWPQLAEKIHAY